jgi:hypothetical protein
MRFFINFCLEEVFGGERPKTFREKLQKILYVPPS